MLGQAIEPFTPPSPLTAHPPLIPHSSLLTPYSHLRSPFILPPTFSRLPPLSSLTAHSSPLIPTWGQVGGEDEAGNTACVYISIIIITIETLLYAFYVYVHAVHPSCYNLTEVSVQVLKSYPWQCLECKTCQVHLYSVHVCPRLIS